MVYIWKGIEVDRLGFLLVLQEGGRVSFCPSSVFCNYLLLRIMVQSVFYPLLNLLPDKVHFCFYYNFLLLFLPVRTLNVSSFCMVYSSTFFYMYAA